MTDQQQNLKQQLWSVANTLRGNMSADEFRDYCLGFIFFKYLSEKVQIFVDAELSTDRLSFAKAMQDKELARDLEEECVDELGFFVKPEFLFHNLAERARNREMIIEDLAKALKDVEEITLGHDSEEDFAGLFEDVDLASSKLGKTVEQKNTIISEVIQKIDTINFRFEDSNSDVLGDAYEYLIGEFAAGAGKKAGEFYTPQQVSEVLARIVTHGKKRLKSVYDPTCGSGSLLLRISKVCEVSDFYGQELNTTTYNLARMNMILHGVRYSDFHIEQGNTLEDPHHLGQRFDAVVANPPFSAHWSANQTFLSDERFSQYGKLAPRTKADFAFVQHMIHQLDDDGTMAVVLPHGVLFRGAAESTIREYIIKELNYLDAVIGLPPNIFYGTEIPTVILVLKKCRIKSNDILFIDASKGFEKSINQNILQEEDIKKIIDTYISRKNIEKFSYCASMEDIIENNYILNIPRYVDTLEEEVIIDIDNIAKELLEIEKELNNSDAEILKFCQELNISAPVKQVLL